MKLHIASGCTHNNAHVALWDSWLLVFTQFIGEGIHLHTLELLPKRATKDDQRQPPVSIWSFNLGVTHQPHEETWRFWIRLKRCTVCSALLWFVSFSHLTTLSYVTEMTSHRVCCGFSSLDIDWEYMSGWSVTVTAPILLLQYQQHSRQHWLPLLMWALRSCCWSPVHITM